jgi:hypothetical protein
MSGDGGQDARCMQQAVAQLTSTVQVHTQVLQSLERRATRRIFREAKRHLPHTAMLLLRAPVPVGHEDRVAQWYAEVLTSKGNQLEDCADKAGVVGGSSFVALVGDLLKKHERLSLHHVSGNEDSTQLASDVEDAQQLLVDEPRLRNAFGEEARIVDAAEEIVKLRS